MKKTLILTALLSLSGASALAQTPPPPPEKPSADMTQKPTHKHSEHKKGDRKNKKDCQRDPKKQHKSERKGTRHNGDTPRAPSPAQNTPPPPPPQPDIQA